MRFVEHKDAKQHHSAFHLFSLQFTSAIITPTNQDHPLHPNTRRASLLSELHYTETPLFSFSVPLRGYFLCILTALFSRYAVSSTSSTIFRQNRVINPASRERTGAGSYFPQVGNWVIWRGCFSAQAYDTHSAQPENPEQTNSGGRHS